MDLAYHQGLVSTGLSRCGLNAVAGDPGQGWSPTLFWASGNSEKRSRSGAHSLLFSTYILLFLVGTTGEVVMEDRLVLFCFYTAWTLFSEINSSA